MNVQITNSEDKCLVPNTPHSSMGHMLASYVFWAPSILEGLEAHIGIGMYFMYMVCLFMSAGP